MQVCQLERDRTIRLMSILYPEATRRRMAIMDNRERVVHYTSADCAMKIISSATMWLRNTNCMSDYTEIGLGFSYLRDSSSDPDKSGLQRFVAAINGCYPNLGADAIEHVNQWIGEVFPGEHVHRVGI